MILPKEEGSFYVPCVPYVARKRSLYLISFFTVMLAIKFWLWVKQFFVNLTVASTDLIIDSLKRQVSLLSG